MGKIYKMYVLIYKDEMKVICKDKFLIELYIVQRNLNMNYVKMPRIPFNTDIYKFFDNYLNYYYGYALTIKEINFITNHDLEYNSKRKEKISNLKNILNNDIGKKKKKNIKKEIEVLKKNRINSMKHIKENLELILYSPNLIDEYMDNIELFKKLLEGDD